MGKEMFASVLWLPESQEPNWPAARRKAQEIIWDETGEDSELTETGIYSDVEYAAHEARRLGRPHDPNYHLQGLLRDLIGQVEKAVGGENREMLELNQYGWRVFITGGVDDNETELGEALETLNRLDILAAAGFNPPEQMIETVIYENRHGTSVCVLKDGLGVAQAASIARESWDEISHVRGVPASPPDDDSEALSIFTEFAGEGGCWINRERLPIQHRVD
ncbi:MAG TPA: hypothetical protein PKD47_09040, partial [Solirubrobacterales bacterium]|nr:hypothetical protein [Solirubrobacterales bacterium]